MNNAYVLNDWFASTTIPPPPPPTSLGSGGQWVYVMQQPKITPSSSWNWTEKIVGVAMNWVKDTTRNSLAEMIGNRLIGTGGGLVMQWMTTSLLRNYVIACLI